jgi:hypothetical protein
MQSGMVVHNYNPWPFRRHRQKYNLRLGPNKKQGTLPKEITKAKRVGDMA